VDALGNPVRLLAGPGQQNDMAQAHKLIVGLHAEHVIADRAYDADNLMDTIFDPARMAARQQRSAAIVAELFNLWETELPLISGKSKLAEAIRYATSRRKVLECFLIDGRVEIDSNIVEHAIRPQTITRKNALFAGSDGGGRTWATIATLLQTAKMNDVDPLTWLAQTLQRIANGWPISQIEKLMPWNYKA
jgi:transposase